MSSAIESASSCSIRCPMAIETDGPADGRTAVISLSMRPGMDFANPLASATMSGRDRRFASSSNFDTLG